MSTKRHLKCHAPYTFYTNPGTNEGFAGRRTDNIHYHDRNDDNLVFRHFSDSSVMNVAYFDGHVDSINYHQAPGAFVSLSDQTTYDH